MNSKRKSLQKIIGISSAATIASNYWTKPLVNSIILPAHAQTSNLCPPMVFGPITATCGVVNFETINTYISVDESGICPALILDPAPSPVDSASYPLRDVLVSVREDPGTVRIVVFQADATDFFDDAIGVRGGGGGMLACVPGDVIQLVKPQPIEIFIRGSNGGRYSAVFDIDVSNDSLVATLNATTITRIQ